MHTICQIAERLERYIEVNDVTSNLEGSNKRRAILIYAIRARTYDV